MGAERLQTHCGQRSENRRCQRTSHIEPRTDHDGMARVVARKHGCTSSILGVDVADGREAIRHSETTNSGCSRQRKCAECVLSRREGCPSTRTAIHGVCGCRNHEIENQDIPELTKGENAVSKCARDVRHSAQLHSASATACMLEKSEEINNRMVVTERSSRRSHHGILKSCYAEDAEKIPWLGSTMLDTANGNGNSINLFGVESRAQRKRIKRYGILCGIHVIDESFKLQVCAMHQTMDFVTDEMKQWPLHAKKVSTIPWSMLKMLESKIPELRLLYDEKLRGLLLALGQVVRSSKNDHNSAK